MDTSHGLYTFSFAHAVTVCKCDAVYRGVFQGESLGYFWKTDGVAYQLGYFARGVKIPRKVFL